MFPGTAMNIPCALQQFWVCIILDCLAATAFNLSAETLPFLWCLSLVDCWEICRS